MTFILIVILWMSLLWAFCNYRRVYLDAYFATKLSCFKGTSMEDLEQRAEDSEVIPVQRGIRKAIVDIERYGWNAKDTRDAFLHALNEYDYEEPA